MATALRIDADRRLVEHEQRGLVDEAAAEVQPPLHAAAEILGEIVGAVAKLRDAERRIDRCRERVAARAIQLAEVRQVLARREVLVDRELLGHEPDRASRGFAVGREVVTGHAHGSARWRNTPHAIEMDVVLPAPFGPSKPKISPFVIVRSSDFTAARLP